MMLHLWIPCSQEAPSFLQLLRTLKWVQNHMLFLDLAHLTLWLPKEQVPMLIPPLPAPPFGLPLFAPLPAPLAPRPLPFFPLPLALPPRPREAVDVAQDSGGGGP